MLKFSKKSALVGLFVLSLAVASLAFADPDDGSGAGGGYWQSLDIVNMY